MYSFNRAPYAYHYPEYSAMQPAAYYVHHPAQLNTISSVHHTLPSPRNATTIPAPDVAGMSSSWPYGYYISAPCKTYYEVAVANLPRDITRSRLKDLFESAGAVLDIHMSKPSTHSGKTAKVAFSDYGFCLNAVCKDFVGVFWYTLVFRLTSL